MNAPGMSAYNVSKAGVYSFSETIYHELRSKNIHVSVVTPTFFQTNIAKGAFGSPKFAAFAEKQMKYSKTNADEMAEVVLTQAAKGKFQIIHPTDARRNFFLKKWFPKLVQKQFDKMVVKFSSWLPTLRFQQCSELETLFWPGVFAKFGQASPRY